MWLFLEGRLLPSQSLKSFEIAMKASPTKKPLLFGHVRCRQAYLYLVANPGNCLNGRLLYYQHHTYAWEISTKIVITIGMHLVVTFKKVYLIF